MSFLFPFALCFSFSQTACKQVKLIPGYMETKQNAHSRKKNATPINHINLWTIFSWTHSHLPPRFFSLNFPRIIDFWYLAFCISSSKQYKIVYKCDSFHFFSTTEKKLLISKCTAHTTLYYYIFPLSLQMVRKKSSK